MVTEMPKPATPVTVINDAVRKGVAVHRFSITKAEGDEIKRIEREHGHDTALRRLLEILRARPNF
jgi:hypothetical protein